MVKVTVEQAEGGTANPKFLVNCYAKLAKADSGRTAIMSSHPNIESGTILGIVCGTVLTYK